MTQANHPQTAPTPLETDKKAKVLELFQRMLPLVQGMASSMRFATLLGAGLVAWLFVWLFFLQGFSLTTALVIAAVALLPIMVLLRFWWALEELKQLPRIVGEMVTDAKTEAGAAVQGIRAGNAPRLGLLSSMKNLWKVGSFAREARELLGSYLSIGTLINPLSLLLGALSLLAVLLLGVIGLVLAVLAF